MMRREKYIFNQLLLRYRKYGRKLQRLELTGRNERRQGIIRKHLERLGSKLESLYASIKLATAGALFAGAMLMAVPEAKAQQTFSDPEVDPFNLISDYNASTPALVDLDGDNVLDVVFGERNGQLFYFHNSGSNQDPSFDSPVEIAAQIGYYSSPSFEDIDGDGDMDMIVSGYAEDVEYEYISRFHYFKNTLVENGTVGFDASVADPLGLPFTTGSNYIYSSQLADVDGDGDLDMVMETNSNGLQFLNRNDVTGNFDSPISLGVYQKLGGLVDLDEDGDLDLLYFDGSGLGLYENTAGQGNSPSFSPGDITPHRLSDGGYNRFFITVGDLDGDGDDDLLAATNDNFVFFEQSIFSFKSPNQNPYSLANAGGVSQPVLVDIDDDGDLDVFSGYYAGSYADNFKFFENIGTAVNPSFDTEQLNPFSLTNIGTNNISVAFADLDDDGDFDLLAGGANGSFYFFKNRLIEDGSVSFESGVENPFGLGSLGSLDRFSFVDLDDDLDYDLLVGKSDGTFEFMENTGSKSAAAFDSPLNILEDVGSKSAPVAIDFDGDEDFDVFAGTSNGFYFFENTGTKSSAVFASPVLDPFGLFDNNGYFDFTPSFGDLDGDGDQDVLSGESSGSFLFFEFESPISFTSVNTANVVENVNGSVLDVDANETGKASDVGIAYSIVGGVDENQFTISATGGLTFITPPDYENPTDADGGNDYVVNVKASTSSGALTQSLTITVTDQTETLLAFTSATAVEVDENVAEAYTARASQTDTGGSVTYSLIGGDDQEDFSIDATTGVVSFVSSPDYENPADANTDNIYQVDVQATDASGSITQSVVIAINDANDNPVTISSPVSGTFSINENITFVTTIVPSDPDVTATFTYELTGTDANSFTIDESGQLQFNNVPDYEFPNDGGGNNVYDLDVTVSDGVYSASLTFEITILNIANEPPVITYYEDASVEEGTTYAGNVNANNGDGGSNDSGITYSVTGTDAAFFTINSTNGIIDFISAPDNENPEDADGNNIYVFDVVVDDGVNTTSQTINVSVTDLNDTAPVLTSTSISVEENTSIVGTVVVSDPDSNNTFSYSIIGGNDQGQFDIDSSTGELSLNPAADFEVPNDANSDNDYEVLIRISDGIQSGDGLVTVTVTNATESNLAFTSGATPSVRENQVWSGIRASVPDGKSSITYSISGGTDASSFTVDPTAGVVFNAAPNFESASDANSDNIYEVEVTADDGTEMLTQTFNVTVIDANDAPVITTSAFQQINEPYFTGNTNFTATDEDGDGLTIWLAGGADAGVKFFPSGSGYYTPVSLGYVAGDDNLYELIAGASDGTETVYKTIIIEILDVNTNTPTITSTAISQVENQQEVNVTATDGDPTDVLSFSIVGGTDQTLFDINGTTGMVEFLVAPDFENPADDGGNNVYNVTIEVSDGTFSSQSAVTITVTDVDEVAPVITLIGLNPQEIEVGGTYSELGATASDDVDGDISGSIVIDASAVNTSAVGSYSVTYNITDAAGNAATQVTRTVDVVDTTIPVITLSGANPQEIEVGNTYTELGATASDNYDGDISGSIIIDASAVNTSAVGSYSITYDVTDTNGNNAVQVTRTVNVVDTTSPVITLTGDDPQEIEVGGTYAELGATANDNYDGDISADIVIDASTVNTSVVGSYDVTYDITDANDNASQAVRTVNITDTTAPVITLTGSDPLEIEVGGTYSESGATASDNYDGDISEDITIDASAVNTSVVGSYDVTYDVTDANGNNTQEVRTVNIVDTTIPEIILIGDNPQRIDVNTTYTELGAIAGDNYDGIITANIVIDASAVNMSVQGIYTVTYNVTDANGNAALEVTRSVYVFDYTPPVITLVGANPQEIEVGGTYTELGATAFDNVDGDITADIFTYTADVNTSVVGSYIVEYYVTDAGENDSDIVERTVNVVDTTVPVITLAGSDILEIELGGTYSELGANATDNYDGDISADIVIDASAVNTSVVGSYEVTYDVTDANGNATQEVRTVNVVDNTAPVITLVGANPQTIQAGTTYTEPGATASDNYDGDISADIVIDASTVNTSALGSYTVTYDVTDASGNDATQVTRTVNIIDTTVPVITLTGDDPLEIEVGGTYSELGATASDNLDGDISGDVVIDASSVNTSVLGSYAVTYDVTDANGNDATQVTRTVNVVDTTAPVITLTGSDPMEIEVNGTYTEPGATASDNYDGDISGNIVIDANTVNTSVVGTYTVTYDVTDANGNNATQVTRTVNVVDTTAPVITLSGDNPQEITFGDAYTEPGATATDNYDGDISSSIVIDATAVNTSSTGDYTVTYNVTDANGNAASEVTRAVSVIKADQSISFGSLASKTFGDPAFDLTATATSGLSVTYTSSNTAVATISGSTVTILGAGTTTITASQPGGTNYNAATAITQDLTVAQATQTITFDPLSDVSLSAGTVDLSGTATASSGLSITYSVQSGPATISGTTLTLTASGTVTVAADQSGNTNYEAAATATQSFNVNDDAKTDQAITFTALDPVKYGDAAFDLTATASSGLDVTYVSSNPDIATISGTTVTIVGVGTTTITASQSGDDTFNPATNVAQDLTVEKGDQVITFDALSGVTYGDPAFDLTGTSDAGLTVTYESSNTAVASISGSTVTIVGAGSADITATQSGSANYNAATAVVQTLTVSKASQLITFDALPDVDVSVGTVTLSATSSAGLSVSYTIASGPATVSGSTVTLTGTGSVVVVASQPGDDNHEAAMDASQRFNVTDATKQDQSITFTTLSDATYGDNFTLSASASSGLSVTYTLISGPAQLTGSQVDVTGVGEIVIEATQTGDDTFNPAAAVSQSFMANKAELTVTADDKTIMKGDALPTFTLTYAGFVNGDDPASLTAEPSASVSISDTNTAGDYPITVSGGEATNYVFGYVEGTLTINQALGHGAQDDIRIYPNPTTRYITVEAKNAHEIVLYDLKGVQVLRSEVYAPVDVSELGRGVYVIRILNTDKELIYNGKIVKY